MPWSWRCDSVILVLGCSAQYRVKRRAAVARCGNEFTVCPTDVARPPSVAEAGRAAGMNTVFSPSCGYEDSVERAVVRGRSSPASQERARTSCPACRPPRTLLRGSVGVPLLIRVATSTTTSVYFDELKRWRPDVSVAPDAPRPLQRWRARDTDAPCGSCSGRHVVRPGRSARGRRWRRPLRSRSPRA